MGNILDNKRIIEQLKNISMKEFEMYLNKYIGENLIVGEQYLFSGRNDIHDIIGKNMLKGFREMCSKYGIDYAIMYETFRISTWEMILNTNVDLISIWENIGQYHFKNKVRKNASIGNSKFTLLDIPYFKFYDDSEQEKELLGMTMYDFFVKMLEIRKVAIITKYESEIESYKKGIEQNLIMIEKIKGVNI